jgi:endoglucanase
MAGAALSSWRVCGRSLLVCAMLLSVAADAGEPVRPAMLGGVNLSGGEFGGSAKVDRYGFSYIYPSRKDAQPFVDAGMKVVRLPLLWERVQHKPFGTLNALEMRRVDDLLKAMAPFAIIIIDIHNFGDRDGVRLDQRPRGGEELADLWTQLARRYKGKPAVAFGIMNEPHGMSARAWRTIADRTMAAIRAEGAGNLVLVPGTSWSGAHSWTHGGAASNEAAFNDFADPANNVLIEMHQYLDSDSSGTHNDCVSPQIAAQRIEAATSWLRKKRFGGFLGEFGSPSDPACLASLNALLAMMERNRDVWRGWTYWSAGPWWGSYFLSVQPGPAGDKPQMTVLRQFLPKPDPAPPPVKGKKR